MLSSSLEDEALRRRCRRTYSEYVQLANKPYGYVLTTFHKFLCDQIQEFLSVRTGKAMDILLLSVPPQHGKSFTVTETLPSWVLGKDPQTQVIICSYDSEFAERFSRRNREKFNAVASDVFRIKPGTEQGVSLWNTEQGGYCRAAGFKAGITGFGADLFIIDDPIKNAEQAQSEVVVAKIHEEMNASVQSRIHPGGKLIVIQTRWVENDVVGFIEENWSEYIWKNINLPAECEDPDNDPLGRKLGESLMGPHLGDIDLPVRIRNDNIWLKSKKALVCAGEGEYTWNALYQGHPSAKDGNLFKSTWWQLYDRRDIDIKKFDYLHLSVDASFKQTETSDRVGMLVNGIYRGEVYIWKIVNKRMGFLDTKAKVKSILSELPDTDELVIEDKANGSAIIDVFRHDETAPPIVAVNPQGGKYSRAQAVSPFVAQGKVHLPTDWTSEEIADCESDTKSKRLPHEVLIEQCEHFPFAKHDDLVDSLSQSLTRLIKLITGEEPKPDRKIRRFVRWYPDMWEDYEQMSPEEQEKFIQTYGAPLEWAEI